MSAPSSNQPISSQHSTGQILVTQVRSGIGAKPKARGALRALGLGKIGRSHTLPDRPEIRGMLRKVRHLIAVENVAGESVTAQEVSDAETA
ncbi:MAG: 50S ribosomal protein L30 [Acidimicrobiales bacterium]|nr:50S ribosomal protein L30 [Acidimicrobiales bacterium]MXZ14787.1 50S ribosomal protein L30 [Acidimicrobiales bacterium]MYB81719.1 50S ribosomal protein L30 [Acidimicrobiales bacterium]MYI14057.1 50S ribosomal protein L30 [Acidimicrobiales bacterium]MYJ47124.1 50S ribosomal protein L30 [Acidimicrobiales bacterium]